MFPHSMVASLFSSASTSMTSVKQVSPSLFLIKFRRCSLWAKVHYEVWQAINIQQNGKVAKPTNKSYYYSSALLPFQAKAWGQAVQQTFVWVNNGKKSTVVKQVPYLSSRRWSSASSMQKEFLGRKINKINSDQGLFLVTKKCFSGGQRITKTAIKQ